jgi:serine/threonine protein kinase
MNALPRLVDQRHRLIKPISKGAMGQVYEAKDTKNFDRRVAVKMLLHHLSEQDDIGVMLRRRFDEDARVRLK